DFASWGGFAQNYADRRIPFEDAACTPYWNRSSGDSLNIPTFAANEAGPFLPGAAIKGALRTAFIFDAAKPGAVRELAAKLTGERTPRHPAEALEQQTAGSRGSDRLRVFAIADSAPQKRETFQVYMLRVSTLVARGPAQFSLGWKQAGRGAVDGKRPEDSTPTFAEMAGPGTVFDGEWRENEFLNRPEVRQNLRWNRPVTQERIFEAANGYAAKQLELHAQYAKWSGLEALGSSVAEVQSRLEAARNRGACVMAIGWGAGFLSKSATIGADEADQRKLVGMMPFYRRAIESGLPFPKTRRVVFLKNKPATLPGWVELQMV
ncbi:MAG: RAMP superfamily CRISPR-associated protein, partial [Acidobacteriota bacterium]|nr:RAMP superfamily CRISPR-associated protein [Acidobacteriota bacterium]